MKTWLDIPEVGSTGNLIRIPDQTDVPVTRRIMKLIDTAPFQRLRRISQLGLVSVVYPGATHSRFEHSLGVYRNAVLFLQQFSRNERFCGMVNASQCTAFLVAALLHDIAHWPFCHPIEDLKLPAHHEHESLAASRILNSRLAELIRDEFDIDPQCVIRMVERKPADTAEQLLCSMLSGPIDVDKMDYLHRDSLHAGVPYGRHFDKARLIGSLCQNRAGDGIAITHKGRTAAELMVFARYVMFSEVYWHHAVRSATAMLQRGYFHWQKSAGADNVQRLQMMDDDSWIAAITEQRGQWTGYFDGLFGPERTLFKRISAYSSLDHPEIFQAIARQPYTSLVEISSALESLLSKKTGIEIPAGTILIDAPPVSLEVQFHVEVYFPDRNEYRPFGQTSPVVRTLAEQQFDDLVKQVRVFADPSVARQIKDVSRDQIDQLLLDASRATV